MAATSLDDILAVYESLRKKKRTRYFIFSILGLTFLIGGFGVFLWNYFSQTPNSEGADKYRLIYALSLTVGILGVVGCGYALNARLSLASSLRNSLQKRYLPSLYGTPKAIKDSAFKADEIAALHLFRPWARYHSNAVLHFPNNGIPFERFEIVLEKETPASHSDHPTYFTYADELVLVLPLRYSLQGQVRLTPKTLHFAPNPKLASLESEYVAFNRAFEIQGSVKDDLFLLLTPDRYEGLIDLENAYQQQLRFAAVGATLFVFFPTAKIKAPVSFFSPIDKKLLEPLFKAIDLPRQVVSVFLGVLPPKP